MAETPEANLPSGAVSFGGLAKQCGVHINGTLAGVLDGVVAELRELERRGGIERILAVGELILTRFFGGSVAAWRDRRRNKNNSIRRLADHSDCPFGRSALNEAVAIYAASLALP